MATSSKKYPSREYSEDTLKDKEKQFHDEMAEFILESFGKKEPSDNLEKNHNYLIISPNGQKIGCFGNAKKNV